MILFLRKRSPRRDGPAPVPADFRRLHSMTRRPCEPGAADLFAMYVSAKGMKSALAIALSVMAGCGSMSPEGGSKFGGQGQVVPLDAGRDSTSVKGTGGSTNTVDGGAGRGVGGATGAGGGAGASAQNDCGSGDAVPDPSLLLMAADFEINSGEALSAYLDCDPTRLTALATIVDANGNSWGPATLGNPGQKTAFANLLRAIFRSIGTPDLPGPGPGGSKGLHGWPDLGPRLAGVGTNRSNNGPGNRAINGGLLGFGVSPSEILAGTFNGEFVDLYKAAAIADGLVDSSGVPLTLKSSNTAFGAAIALVGTNPRMSIGLANNIAQCALTISLGVDADGAVLANPTTFKKNIVEKLFDYECSPDNGGAAGGGGGGGGGGDAAYTADLITTPSGAGSGGIGTGGIVGTGGAGTGGAVSTGGSVSGGATATGGASTGGRVGTGGAGTGGAVSTGGSGTGGATATGGAASGGAAVTGGVTGNGGAPGCPDLDQDAVPDCRQTLMSNPGFDQGTTGWAASPVGSASFKSIDGNANPMSGSIAVDNTDTDPKHAPTGWTTASASQCLAVSPGSVFAVSVQVSLPQGQTGGAAGFELDYYASPDCTGATATIPFLSPQVSAAGAWQVVTAATTQVPVGVSSIAVRLVAEKPVGQTSLEALFDNVLVRAR